MRKARRGNEGQHQHMVVCGSVCMFGDMLLILNCCACLWLVLLCLCDTCMLLVLLVTFVVVPCVSHLLSSCTCLNILCLFVVLSTLCFCSLLISYTEGEGHIA